MKIKLKSQPRIKGIKREPKYSSYHPFVRDGLKSISRFEKKSISWVIAQIVSDYFGIDCATGKVIRKNKKVA